LIDIIEFELEHLDLMDMREHEKNCGMDYYELKLASKESKTALWDGEILCCWGLLEDNGMWQIPSKRVAGSGIFYARRAIKVIRKMIGGKPGVYSICLADDSHDRWMRFIGLEPNYDKTYHHNGKDYLMYEVK